MTANGPADPRRARLTSDENLYRDPTRFWQHGPKNRVYLIIDLKSFYASVECVERGLDPMTAKLVVADPDRSEGTICLAVSPALKALGVRNRCRIYEIPDSIDYIVAPPQMKHYMDCSAEIYSVYLQYLAPEDIHVYSIDEAFMDVTSYLDLYQMTPKELGIELMNAVLDRTGIRSTCGIGTNLYLAKIALDITAKHSPDFIGILDEDTYREKLWDHRPLTDFWMIAGGISRRLSAMGIFTMRQIAQAAMTNDRPLYRTFGINAEILIDHAFGVEPVTIADIKGYKSKTRSFTAGQTLLRDYSYEEAEVVVKEMIEELSLKMTRKKMVTDTVALIVIYSHTWRDNHGFPASPTGGTIRSPQPTDSAEVWKRLITKKYEDTARRDAPVRRLGVYCSRIFPSGRSNYQYTFLTDSGFAPNAAENAAREEASRKIQETVLEIRRKYGRNSIMRGMNLEAAGTMLERHDQIGGHKSGTMSRVVKEKLKREGRLSELDEVLQAPEPPDGD